MAFKRNVDRLPIIPPDAKEHTVVCHFCIVGCGYRAYSWDVNRQGGSAPTQNRFAVDLAKQQPAETAAWYSPSMYKIIKQDGKDVHLVIKPEPSCEVNSGLGSIRGARLAELSYSRVTQTQQRRLTDPMVWRFGQMQPTSWDDALDLVARVTAAVIKEQGEDGLFVSAFDHGGAGGGYVNSLGIGATIPTRTPSWSTRSWRSEPPHWRANPTMSSITRCQVSGASRSTKSAAICPTSRKSGGKS